MKRHLVVSLPLIVLGALLAAIPVILLPVCPVHAGAAPMKCHWTGIMLNGFGWTILIFGILLFFCRAPGVRAGLSLGVLLLTALAGLVPIQLIGLCSSPTMQCRTGTFPATMIVLVLIASACVFNILFLRYCASRESSSHEAPHNPSHRPE